MLRALILGIFALTLLAKYCFLAVKKVSAYALDKARIALPEALAFKKAGAFALDKSRLASSEALVFTTLIWIEMKTLASHETMLVARCGLSLIECFGLSTTKDTCFARSHISATKGTGFANNFGLRDLSFDRNSFS